MTPRAYWDADGYLWQESGWSDHLCLMWSASTGIWCEQTHSNRYDVVDALYGPLVAVA